MKKTKENEIQVFTTFDIRTSYFAWITRFRYQTMSLLCWSDHSKTLAIDLRSIGTLSSLAVSSNSKVPTPLSQRSGIYPVLCGDCVCFFIGQTRRILQDRLAEYISTSTGAGGVNKSAFAEHIRNKGHAGTRAEIILHPARKGRVMNKLKEMNVFIHDSNPLLLNDIDTQFILFAVFNREKKHTETCVRTRIYSRRRLYYST